MWVPASARSGWRWPGSPPRAFADLVEIDPDLARLGEINAARNGLQARARVLRLDVLKPRERREAGLNDEAVDCVVTNPPFFERGTIRVSPDTRRARAHVFSSTDADATLANLDSSLTRDPRRPAGGS